MNTSENGAIDESKKRINALASFESSIGIMTTIDTSTKENRVKLLKIMEGDSERLDSMIGKTIMIKDWAARSYDMEDEATGELKPMIFIVVIDEKGKVYRTSSVGVRRSIIAISGAMGISTYDPPVKVRVDSIPLEGGKKTLKLTVL